MTVVSNAHARAYTDVLPLLRGGLWTLAIDSAVHDWGIDQATAEMWVAHAKMVELGVSCPPAVGS